MTGILKGVKIVEMGHWVAVPSACAVFADWGAEVIKVEPLTGDAARGLTRSSEAPDPYVVNGVAINWRIELHNRGKKSLAVDATKKAGWEIIQDLVRDADIFATNYEFNSLKKLKLTYTDLHRVNPRLIYALLTGYGTKGPDQNERGFDYAAAWAHSGIQYMIGEPGTIPPPQRGGMMDRTAGLELMTGVLAALWHREKTGKGQEVSISLYHVGVWTLAADIQAALLGLPLPKYQRFTMRNPLANIYRTRDDRWIQMIMLQADLQWHGFCRAINKPELENDPRFNSAVSRATNCEELIRQLDTIFASKDLSEWEIRLRENDCIFSSVRTPTEVTTDPQALVNNFFTTIPHPVAGELQLVNSPVQFHQKPPKTRSPAPEVGQHTEGILLKLGYNWERIALLKEEKVIL